MAESVALKAFRQMGYRAGKASAPYRAAEIGRKAGEAAEFAYASGYRIGKRERLRAETKDAA